MIIRPLVENDIPACVDIVVNAPVWMKYGLTVEVATQRLTDAMTRPDSVVLVADDEQGHVIGVTWLLKRAGFDLSGYIRWLAVAANQRGGGIGQKLLAAAEAQIQTPARDMFLLCADFNVDAQRFYERNGYSRIGTIENYVVPGVGEIIYRKRL